MSINGTYRERNPALENALENWSISVLQGWVSRMESLGMFDSKHSTRALARSLHYTIIWEARTADQIEYLHRIKFAFNFYGKLVDYGIGRGTDIKDRFEGGRNSGENNRKRKEWMYQPWRNAQPVLIKILGKRMGETIKVMLKQNFESETDTFFKTKNI